MIKRAGTALLGLLCVCSPLLAQQQFDPLGDGETITSDQLRTGGEVNLGPALSRYRPDLFSDVDGSLLIHGLPVVTLLNGRRFPLSGDLGGMGVAPLDLVPLAFLSSVQVQKTGASPLLATDAPGGVVDLRLNNISSGGELGVFFGGSGGKDGRQDFESYIRGSVGTDKFQISAGAAYEHSSGSYRSYRY